MTAWGVDCSRTSVQKLRTTSWCIAIMSTLQSCGHAWSAFVLAWLCTKIRPWMLRSAFVVEVTGQPVQQVLLLLLLLNCY